MSAYELTSAIFSAFGLIVSIFAIILAYKSNKISQKANRRAEEADRIISEAPARGVGFSLDNIPLEGLGWPEKIFRITLFNVSTYPATNVRLHLPDYANPGDITPNDDWVENNPFSGPIMTSNGKSHYPMAPLIPGKTKEIYIKTSTLIPVDGSDAEYLLCESKRDYASQIWLSFIDSQDRYWLFDGIKHNPDDPRIPRITISKRVNFKA